jgi:hypothetical protein
MGGRKAKDAHSAILNLEQGERTTRWDGLFFMDVDGFSTPLARDSIRGIPQDASRGERYFYVPVRTATSSRLNVR